MGVVVGEASRFSRSAAGVIGHGKIAVHTGPQDCESFSLLSQEDPAHRDPLAPEGREPGSVESRPQRSANVMASPPLTVAQLLEP